MALDTNEKPFACWCGALFSRRDLLRRHERLARHTPGHDLPPSLLDDSEPPRQRENGFGYGAGPDVLAQREQSSLNSQGLGHVPDVAAEKTRELPYPIEFPTIFPSQISLGKNDYRARRATQKINNPPLDSHSNYTALCQSESYTL